MSWEIRQGDALERLREMPDRSVHLVVCSPPYFSLRDYGTATWEGGDPACGHRGRDVRTVSGGNGKQYTNPGSNRVYSGDCRCGARRVDQQIGLEETPGEYLEKMLAVFREIWRVLRDDGVCFVNLGDSYAANRSYQVNGTKQTAASQPAHGSRVPAGLRPKSLIGIPWRFALAMIDEGWILRSEIIWSKKAPMPESATDRCTKAHEQIFMFAKQERYFYDALAVAEPATSAGKPIKTAGGWDTREGSHGSFHREGREAGKHNGSVQEPTRNLRDVWHLGPEPMRDAHYATYPTEIPHRCIAAGTSERGCCPACGAPWKRVVEHTPMVIARSDRAEAMGPHGRTQASGTMLAPATAVATGWLPTCTCNAGEPVPCTVLDPFSGAATTGVVALKLGRNYLGIELSAEYIALSERRLRPFDAFQPSLL